jgi:hypothetical protein
MNSRKKTGKNFTRAKKQASTISKGKQENETESNPVNFQQKIGLENCKREQMYTK